LAWVRRQSGWLAVSGAGVGIAAASAARRVGLFAKESDSVFGISSSFGLIVENLVRHGSCLLCYETEAFCRYADGMRSPDAAAGRFPDSF
jgi:hypothetical protein